MWPSICIQQAFSVHNLVVMLFKIPSGPGPSCTYITLSPAPCIRVHTALTIRHDSLWSGPEKDYSMNFNKPWEKHNHIHTGSNSAVTAYLPSQLTCRHTSKNTH